MDTEEINIEFRNFYSKLYKSELTPDTSKCKDLWENLNLP